MPRTPTNSQVKESSVRDAEEKLKRLAKSPKHVSLKDALQHLLPSIQAAVSQGYSLEEICNLMESCGITVKPGTLSRLLSKLGSELGSSSSVPQPNSTIPKLHQTSARLNP